MGLRIVLKDVAVPPSRARSKRGNQTAQFVHDSDLVPKVSKKAKRLVASVPIVK
jgi:hypothetical protein